ncbi:unnamed protein product [Natator depressus]
MLWIGNVLTQTGFKLVQANRDLVKRHSIAGGTNGKAVRGCKMRPRSRERDTEKCRSKLGRRAWGENVQEGRHNVCPARRRMSEGGALGTRVLSKNHCPILNTREAGHRREAGPSVPGDQDARSQDFEDMTSWVEGNCVVHWLPVFPPVI